MPAALLRAVGDVLPGAELHTPYGMTEVLPVTDISLAEIDARRARATVCASGARCPGSRSRIAPLDARAAPDGRADRRRPG